MPRLFLRTLAVLSLVLSLLAAQGLEAQWNETSAGVSYKHFATPGTSIHVVRVDLNAGVSLIASDSADRGLTVDEFADRYDTLVSINGDYFNEAFEPIGPAKGSCEPWGNGGTGRREVVVGASGDRVEIVRMDSPRSRAPAWMDQAVAGWPLLVSGCKSLHDSLPGSAGFTHSPHPRTAVGLSGDGRWLYMVVAEGRTERVPGLTLPELARFMREELGACSAVNLDGGGSSHMVVGDRTINRLSDGSARRVANHLGVIREGAIESCEIRQSVVARASVGKEGTYARLSQLEEALAAGRASQAEKIELARMYLARGRFWEAKQLASAMLEQSEDETVEEILDEAEQKLIQHSATVRSSASSSSASDPESASGAGADEVEQAEALLAAGRFWEAAELARDILRENPDSGAEEILAAAERGLDAARREKLAAARAQAAAPGASENDRFQLAEALFSAGEYDEAISIYDSLGETVMNREARIHHARALSWSGRLERAEQIYNELLREESDPALRLEYGRVLSWMGAQRAAVGELRSLYEVTPSDEAVVALANALAWSGRRIEALELLRRHHERTGSETVAEKIAELNVSPELQLEAVDQLIAENPYNLSLRLERARLLVDAGRYSGAIRELEFIDMNSPREREQLDALLSRARELQEAEINAVEERLARLDPDETDDPSLLLDLARRWTGLDRYDRSIPLYERYLAMRPGDLDARIEYARVLGWDRRYDAAIDQYALILSERPDRADLRLEYARILSWDERYSRAIDELSALTDISDNPRARLYESVPVEARFSLGQIYRWFGWHEHAIEQQQLALQRESTFQPAMEELTLVRNLRPASTVEGRYTHSETASDFQMDRLDLQYTEWESRTLSWEALLGWHDFQQGGRSVDAISAAAGLRKRVDDQTTLRGRVGGTFYDDDSRPYWNAAVEWLPALQSRAVLEYAHYDLVYDASTLRTLRDDILYVDDLRLHYDHDTGGYLSWLADLSYGWISDDNTRLAGHGLLTFELHNDPFVAVKVNGRFLEHDFRSPRYWSPQDYQSLAGVIHVGDNFRERFFWDAEFKYGRSWEEDRSRDLRAVSVRATVPVLEDLDLIAAYSEGESGRIDSPVSGPDLVTYWQRRWYVGFRLRRLFDRTDGPRRDYYYDDESLRNPALPYGEDG